MVLARLGVGLDSFSSFALFLSGPGIETLRKVIRCTHKIECLFDRTSRSLPEES